MDLTKRFMANRDVEPTALRRGPEKAQSRLRSDGRICKDKPLVLTDRVLSAAFGAAGMDPYNQKISDFTVAFYCLVNGQDIRGLKKIKALAANHRSKWIMEDASLTSA
jgi:hypothetical protein